MGQKTPQTNLTVIINQKGLWHVLDTATPGHPHEGPLPHSLCRCAQGQWLPGRPISTQPTSAKSCHNQISIFPWDSHFISLYHEVIWSWYSFSMSHEHIHGNITQIIHGAGISTYIFTPFLWPSFVGQYTSTMDDLGHDVSWCFLSHSNRHPTSNSRIQQHRLVADHAMLLDVTQRLDKGLAA